MTIDDITNYLKDKSQNQEAVGGKLKLLLDDSIIFIDGSGTENIISHEDSEADCVIIASIDTLLQLKEGKLNPMMAMMTGKLKVKGNVMLASKLEKLL